MKRIKVISVVMTFIIIAQLLSLISSANGFKSDVVESNDIKIAQTDEINKESGLSAEVTEEELRKAYKTFNQFTEENNLPVVFDYESFKEEYFTLGYSGVNEYLEALYGIFDLTSKEDTSQYVSENDINDNAKPEDYREGLDYSEEILQAYEDYAVALDSENLPIELCLEDFVHDYEQSKTEDVFDFRDEVIDNYTNNQDLTRSAEINYYSTNSSSGSSSSGSSGSSGSSSDGKYYYRVNGGLRCYPNYSKYNIMQLAQKGDIILDDNGSFGIFGHAAIVDGKVYDPNYGYYIRVIESGDGGVTYGLWDAKRTDDRDTYLYKVFTATPDEKAKAVEFCRGQLGKPWSLNLSHNYGKDTSPWMCSQLVWAGYKNQGVDIELNGGSGGEPGVTPHDITVNSSMVTHVDFRENLHTVEDGTYYLTNLKSGKRLDIRGGTPGQSIQVQQYGSGVYSEQKWRFRYYEAGRYYIISSDITNNGTFYLDVAQPHTGSHAKVKLWNKNTNEEEKWYIQKVGANTYRFINGYSGLCMDIAGGSVDNKADVQVYPYVGSDDQKWMLSRCGTQIFSNGTYYITNYRSGLRLDIRGGTPGNSVQVQQYQAGNYPEQKWVLEWSPVWSCYYIKSNITSGGNFYLDVAQPYTGSHAKVKLWHEWTRPEERWTIIPTGIGTYNFINGYDGLCMDIMGGSTENRADVQVYPLVHTTDQMWLLTKAS